MIMLWHLSYSELMNSITPCIPKSIGFTCTSNEYISEIRSIFNKDDVSYQTGELGKVDEGGGGTIAYIMANYGMNVIDSGVAVLNMHAPNEIISKADIFEAFKGYVSFLKNIK